MAFGLRLFALFLPVRAWNSHHLISQIYSFQDFYTDAQYGPDFGYYSTGRILHQQEGGGQEWFNSYTTLPMSLSPYFAQALCDRVVSMWVAMGKPHPFVIMEFGGGTGMLARDILAHARDAHPEFFAALSSYFIAERSQAMRAAQNSTAAEFVSLGKLRVLPADGRHAHTLRKNLEGPDGRSVGVILSNELLDEFDPVRLRLMWRQSQPPSQQRCEACDAYREAYVLHSIDISALRDLLPAETGEPVSEEMLQEIWQEGQQVFCGLLQTAAMRRVMLSLVEDLTPQERWQCVPMLACCFPLVLAVAQALQYHHEALYQAELEHRDEAGERELVKMYRALLRATNTTVALSKERYRQMRRLAARRGFEVERALLVGDEEVLPGRMRSIEVFLSLTPARCKELQAWRRRHSARLSMAAKVRDASAPVYHGTASSRHTAVYMKLVLRPGEASFVEGTAGLLDEGFMITLDYGADADSLLWFSTLRPHYDGIHIMDARTEFDDVCTQVSFLECPGLQDLTTSVDFTEVALAGAEHGWQVKAYGPIWLLELAFDRAGGRLGHLLERAGGLRSPQLQAWYVKTEEDPWASFKILVQHRGSLGTSWSLGPMALWPLEASPRMLRAPATCWSRDITKPPLASLVTTATHGFLGEAAWDTYAKGEMTGEVAEGPEVAAALAEQLVAFLHQDHLTSLLESQHRAQQQQYADAHLAGLLVDYWRLQEALPWDQQAAEVRQMAASRLLPALYGEEKFENIFVQLMSNVFTLNTSSMSSNSSFPPYLCMAAQGYHDPA